MLTDSQTITVDSIGRVYEVTNYPERGAVRKCELTDGDSIHTIGHETVSGGVERTLVKMQDERTISDVQYDLRFHVVLSCIDDPTARAELVKLTEGGLTHLLTAGLLADILQGQS